MKPFDLTGRLVLAPMAGFTDSPFRRIARRHGAALVYTELVSAEGIARGNRKTHELMRFLPEERPIAIQLFGKEAGVMAEAARRVEQLGPDVIDINMGCCAPRVCSGGSGAGLLQDPALAGQIAAAVTGAVGIPVSVKIRIGWDESTRNYRELVPRLEDAGVSLIAVHGRTRAQKYTGSADWDAIALIAAASKLPVIGNGDIHSYGDAIARLETSGCAAVMIGRAAIGNPWIFSGLRPSVANLAEEVRSHLRLMREFYGEPGIVLMRKHLARYFHGFRNAARLRAALVRSISFDEAIGLVGRFENGEFDGQEG
ncbi:MAG: tRNA dihydrouridine synthase DusB [Spirochaetes bacterium]|jgi:nifR3 family TIM-barrel protein|nr:tRNA dihydrouridine synthase DusB [Spirochaetota bacterium]